MALAGGDPFTSDTIESVHDKVIEGIRGDGQPFSWGQPPKVPRVSADDQAAQREAIEARHAEAIAAAEAARAANAETAVDVDAAFAEAIVGAVAMKAGEVALARPNVHTSTEGEMIRWRERVAADERARIEAEAAATKQAAEAADVPEGLGDYFTDLDVEVPADDDDGLDEADFSGEPDAYDYALDSTWEPEAA